MGKKVWKKKLVYSVYIFILLNLIVTTERIVFDVFGRMWVTLLVNALTGLSSLVCLLGLYYRKKSAIIAYSIVAMVTVGINVVIILMYNNVGALKGTEVYLSVPIKSHSWWSNHGFLCYPVCNSANEGGNGGGGGGGGGGNNNEGSGGVLSLIDGPLLSNSGETTLGSGQEELVRQACFVTYTVIESTHSILNASLTLITVLLSFCMIWAEGKSSSPEEGESSQYMSIGRFGGKATELHSAKKTQSNKGRHSYYKLSDSFETIGSNKSNTASSSSSL